MTGANFGVASRGEVVVCTNEGNADMGTTPGVFIRLLARSATGQPITAYTSHYRKPGEGKEIHLIPVDNGRSRLLGNKEHFQLLKCIRCGACMNTCPVYRRSGGYSYTYFIPGPVGVNLGTAKDPVILSTE